MIFLNVLHSDENTFSFQALATSALQKKKKNQCPIITVVTCYPPEIQILENIYITSRTFVESSQIHYCLLFI